MSLESAESVLRRNGSSIPEESRAETSRRQCLHLVAWAREHGRLLEGNDALAQEFLATTAEIAFFDGQEHRVGHDENSGRVLKITYPGHFGIAFPIRDGLPVPSPATPLEYLARLRWSNELFGDDVHLERILLDQDRLDLRQARLA